MYIYIYGCECSHSMFLVPPHTTGTSRGPVHTEQASLDRYQNSMYIYIYMYTYALCFVKLKSDDVNPQGCLYRTIGNHPIFREVQVVVFRKFSQIIMYPPGPV